MSGYSEPEWVNPSAGTTSATVTEDANTGGNITAPTATPTATTTGRSSRGDGSLALMGLSILGMGLAAMMAGLGVLTIIEVHESGVADDLSEPFLAAYMVMFALLLFMYELMWWTPLPAVNKAMRKNFGFLYGLRGKGLFLIFVACLCLGLGKDASIKELNWATGISFLAVGCLHWFVICFHPDLASKYVAPTAGLTSTDDNNSNNVV